MATNAQIIKSVYMLNAASGSVVKLTAIGEFEATALTNVAERTPNAGDLSAFEAPKEPTNCQSRYAITVMASTKVGGETVLRPE